MSVSDFSMIHAVNGILELKYDNQISVIPVVWGSLKIVEL
jgi:hypothetical protein